MGVSKNIETLGDKFTKKLGPASKIDIFKFFVNFSPLPPKKATYTKDTQPGFFRLKQCFFIEEIKKSVTYSVFIGEKNFKLLHIF